MTATDYFKWLAKKEKPRTIKATPYQEAMFSLLAEFKCVASNVNQIAKVMNTEKKTFYTVTVKEDLIARTLATVQTVSSDIIKQINYGSPWQDQGERQSASQLPDEEGGQ